MGQRPLKIADGAEYDTDQFQSVLTQRLEQELNKDGGTNDDVQTSRQESASKNANDERVSLLQQDAESEESNREQDESSDELQEGELTENSDDAILKEAISLGYNPNYKGEGAKTPEQWLSDGSFIRDIKSRDREIRDLKSSHDEMARHIQNLTKMLNSRESKTIDRDIAYYDQARKEAYQEGDDSRAELIEAEMRKLEKEKESFIHQETQDVAPKVAPEAQAFFNRNQSWMQEQTPEANMMRAYSQARDIELTSQGVPIGELVQIVESELRQKFPHRFGEYPTQRREAKVASNHGRSTTKPRRAKEPQLSAVQEKMAKYFSDRKIMSRDDYIQQLKDLGEL